MLHQGKDDSGPAARRSPAERRRRRQGRRRGTKERRALCRRSQTSGAAAFPIKGNPQEEQFTSSLAYNIIFALGL